MEAMAAAAPVVSAVGTAVNVVGGVARAGAQVANANTEAYYERERGKAIQDQAEEEAKLLEREAIIEEENMAYEVEMHNLKVNRFISSQRAKFAASGVQMEGSVITAIADTAAWAESEKAVIEREYTTRAESRRQEAYLTRRRGYTGAMTGQYLGAAAISRGRTEALGTLTTTGSTLFQGLAGA